MKKKENRPCDPFAFFNQPSPVWFGLFLSGHNYEQLIVAQNQNTGQIMRVKVITKSRSVKLKKRLTNPHFRANEAKTSLNRPAEATQMHTYDTHTHTRSLNHPTPEGFWVKRYTAAKHFQLSDKQSSFIQQENAVQHENGSIITHFWSHDLLVSIPLWAAFLSEMSGRNQNWTRTRE